MANTDEAKKGDGGSIPEEAPKGGAAKATPPAAATRSAAPAAKATPPAASTPEPEAPAARPETPEGYVLFENGAEHPVEFTLRDGENRGRKQVVGAGKTCLVPKEYADAVRNHAPQLRRVG